MSTSRNSREMISAASLVCALFTVTGKGLTQTQGQVQTTSRAVARVLRQVDKASVTPLSGTHPAAVDHAALGARVANSTPLKHLILVLQPSEAQDYALRSFLDAQQDKTSSTYHKWLTPEGFGASFGVASSDVAAVTGWLQDSGLTVDSVAKSNRYIVFSGTAGAVEGAFHTEMHHVTVDGESHISNTSDISVPAALVPVVRGVASLNNFLPKANIVDPQRAVIPTTVTTAADGKITVRPNYTSTSTGAHYVTPGDAAVIYNSTPLLTNGIDGTGQTIAVLGRSNITLSDVQQFRSMFGLKKMDPTFTILGEDPGINTDDLEAYLDVEWAGGMAPGASVNFVIGGSDYFTQGGIGNAGLYAVDNNLADIVTLSYGGCETNNGASGTAFWTSLWEQAAAQGQSVFVSSGDSNATGCSSSSAAYGTAYGVNALGSSNYNVAVGGSMFVDYGPSQYWGSGVTAPAPSGYTFTTATGYIPEAAWNQGLLASTYLNTLSTGTVTGSGIVGTGGGISIYAGRPSWQTGSGIPATADVACSTGTCIATGSPVTGAHRLVPDISFIAASGHAATAFCGEGSCSNTNSGYGIGAIGGTSVATPVMASVQALINQQNGGRQGNPNFHYYPLANADYLAGNCKSVNGTAANPTVTLPAATCNFHDIVAGNNRAPQNATDTTGLGFDAGRGFDAATGLGSVNIANVATNWNSVAFRATATSFTLTPTSGLTHGASQLLNVSVAAAGSGTPTGDISVIAETTTPGTMQQYTLTGGAYSGSIAGLPGGSYNVHIHYAGDGTFAPSDSASIPVTIGKESSATTLSVADFYPGYVQTSVSSIPYGYLVDIVSQASGTSGQGIPTGTTTFTVTQNGATLPGYTGTVDATGTVALVAGAAYTSLYVAPNYPTLTPGAYTVIASYSGDASFAASTASTSFTVARLTPTATLTASSAYISSGTSVTLNYSIARVTSSTFPTLAAYPTGSVTFTDTTTGATLGTASVNSAGLATLTTTAITTSGANSISAVYSGDTNYAPVTGTASITVGSLTSTSTTVSVASGTYAVGSSVTMTATVSPAAAATVRFYDGATLLGSATSSASTGVASLATGALIAGTHTLSASFAGTTTYAASSGTASLTVNQAATTLTLDAPVASTYGQTISLNGRIIRNPSTSTPVVGLTGTVTFKDAGATIATGTPVFLPGGYYAYVATVPTPVLTAGSHTLTATYSGDANYMAASSASVTTSVARLTPSLTVTSGANTYTTSAMVPLTATLGVSSALAAPTAPVTFYDGNSSLGSATPTYSSTAGAYVATLNVPARGAGSHTFTAAYAGDTNYAAASGTLTVLISSNNVWVANGNGSVSALSSNGSAVLPVAVTGGGTAIAVDGTGNVWSLNKSANSVAEFSNAGSVISSGYKTGGLAAPTALAIDGAGMVWIANGNGTLTGLTSSGTAAAALPYAVGTSTPTAVVVDGSGNLWITNAGDNSVTEVIGVAAPVATPTVTAVQNNTLATRP